MSFINSGRIISAMCGTYNENFMPEEDEAMSMRTVSWSDPRDVENQGDDLIHPMQLADIQHMLSTLFTGEKENLFTLAGDANLFWNALLYFEDSGTLGLSSWDNMIRIAMENPDMALIGFEEVPDMYDQFGQAPGTPNSAAWPSSLSSSQDNEERPPCKFFQSGDCRYGDTCWYSHGAAKSAAPSPHSTPTRPSGHRSNNSTPARSSPSGPICKFFQSPAGCRNGSGCRFSHAQDASRTSRPSSPFKPEPEDSDDDIDFTSVGGKDYINPCTNCGKVPSVSGVGLCSMCNYGTADWGSEASADE